MERDAESVFRRVELIVPKIIEQKKLTQQKNEKSVIIKTETIIRELPENFARKRQGPRANRRWLKKIIKISDGVYFEVELFKTILRERGFTVKWFHSIRKKYPKYDPGYTIYTIYIRDELASGYW